MSYLVISNRGEVDPQAFTLLGASVKDEGGIGFFGSGNKYAIAALFRLGIQFRVFSGEREIQFSLRPTSFRDESFDVIYIDGKATSITTRTGPKWEARDAIRELYSNALDEGEGSYELSSAEPHGRIGRTDIWITATSEVMEMVNSWSLFFIPRDAEVLHETEYGRIVNQPVPNFYRRGVWICEDRENVPLFSYDFNEFNLPESRKVHSGTTSWYLYRLMSGITNPVILDKFLDHVSGRKGEKEWDSLSGFGADSITISNLADRFKSRFDFIGDVRIKDKITLMKGERVLWCRATTFNVLHSAGCTDITVALNFNADYTITDWPIGVKAQVNAEVAFLASHGIDLSPFDIKFAEFHNDKVIALADMKMKRVIIGSDALFIDRRMLRRALIEEWTHLAKDVADCTVEQQHVYLDVIVGLLEANESMALRSTRAKEMRD